MASNEEKYRKAWAAYEQLAKAAANGNAQAKKDKAVARQECRHMEREASREGVILNEGRNITPEVLREQALEEIPSKRDLQKDYVNKFDNTAPVIVGAGKRNTGPIARDESGKPITDKTGTAIRGELTTLQRFHRKRLGLTTRSDE